MTPEGAHTLASADLAAVNPAGPNDASSGEVRSGSSAKGNGNGHDGNGHNGNGHKTASTFADLVWKKDWSDTPIGPVEGWSPTLKTIVGFLLANRFPLLLWWGPQYVSIYNEAYGPILGNKHPDAIGLPFKDVWPEIQHVLLPLIDAPFNGGEPTWADDIELEINRRGFIEESHFTIAYSPVPDEAAPRGIGGVLATVNEITEKVVSERRIAVLRDLGARAGGARTQEEAAGLVVDALAKHGKDIPFALIYLLDTAGATATLAAASGIGTEQRAALAQIRLEDTRDSGPWPFARIAETKAPETVSGLRSRLARVPRGPWSDPPNTAVVLPLRTIAQGEVTGFVVAGVSARLALDESYRAFLDLLAAQISSGLGNARAYQIERERAEKLAEIDRAKTMFFSNISHEFRTPLGLILGPLTDALTHDAPLEGPQLELAHRNSLRLLKLVNSLLDFSRIEAGRVQATYQATDLAQFTKALASNFRSACEQAGLALTIDCPKLSQPAYVDRDMWEKIILNLLSNAFKFTFDGEIAVSLRETEGMVELLVRDTGVGVPEAEMPRLFERFHRIERQKSRTHEGSGIGLALVYELVKLHGGTISADSTEGKGTAFTVRIPLGSARLLAETSGGQSLPSTSVRADAFLHEALRWLPDADVPQPEAVRDLEEPEDTYAIRRGDRVLVVDDNADMRDYLRRLLSGRCDVHTVPDGRAALANIRREPPDLVITDVMMPLMDGFQLLREIRADPALREIPVILLSARAGEASRVEGLASGADDYLVKPFSARELIARVGANLQLARFRSEAAATLRVLNETLEQRVSDESAQRARMEEALRQSQKMEAIGQLTGGLAHDFNNLLAAVGGAFGLIERRLADRRAGVERYVRAGQDAVRRAATLTQRLLAFSRQQNLDPRPLDANKLISGMEDLIRRTVGPAIEVEVVGAGGLWPTKVDSSQLESSLLNLCINARDAMMPEGGRLTIETANKWLDARAASERDLAPGQYVSICVTDTGTGMSAEVKEKAFDPFFTTKPLGQGTGLGLSMVYGFVRQSGGQVRIYSEPRKGTTMSLYLPRHLGEAEEAPEAHALEPAHEGAGETVLVVDDEPTLRMLICDVLEDHGYKVLLARDGQTALRVLETGVAIDLMISDVGLPGGMNGRQVATEARKLRPGLKVLFITGFAENAVVGHGLLAPGMEVMTKPFEITSLAAKVSELIEKA